MQMYSIGELDFNKYDLENIEKCNYDYLVYSYQSDCGGYGGDGKAIAFYKEENTNFYVYELSHCSCYGPLSGDCGQLSFEQLLQIDEECAITDNHLVLCKKKVLEILGK
jgi:hypothetical protein